MVMLFTILYKTDFKRLPSGIELFHMLSEQFRPETAPCPSCGTYGRMKAHDSYWRFLIDYDGTVQENIVRIKRVICTICDSTHALLPDVLVPHKSFCILFILKVLKEYFHTRAATAICNKYSIAVSTLYAWIDRYLTHVSIDLGVLESILLNCTRWLTNASDICRSDAPYDFFSRFGFSFLQHSETTRFSSA